MQFRGFSRRDNSRQKSSRADEDRRAGTASASGRAGEGQARRSYETRGKVAETARGDGGYRRQESAPSAREAAGRTREQQPDNIRRMPGKKKHASIAEKLHIPFLDTINVSLLLNLLIILGFGLLMVYSSSSYVAARDHKGDQRYFFDKQLRWDLIGLAGMILATVIPYQIWKKLCNAFYLVALGAMLLVIPWGIESHQATRWVAIPGTGMQFQPSEIAKVAVIMFVAYTINRLGKDFYSIKGALRVAVPILPLLAEILGLTSHLSSTLIVAGITFFMMFIASRNYAAYLGVAACGALAAGGITAYVVRNYASRTAIEEGNYRFGRIVAWLYPELSTDDAAHQTLNSLYAIGNGGFLGKGLGQSVQKISALPEPHNDFIFAIICEELGIVGAIALMMLYALLILQMYRVAKQTSDRFGFLIVVGVMSHIAIQMILHIAVNTASMPNTGVSLPFVSYGGSSAVLLLAEMGLVLSVHRQSVLRGEAEV